MPGLNREEGTFSGTPPGLRVTEMPVLVLPHVKIGPKKKKKERPKKGKKRYQTQDVNGFFRTGDLFG